MLWQTEVSRESLSREEEGADGRDEWCLEQSFLSNPDCPELRERHSLISGSYGQFLFWLFLYQHSGHLCQWKQRPHTLPLFFEMIQTWKESCILGQIFFLFILRLWRLAYPLGQGCHFFSDYKMNTQLCRNSSCVLHPDYEGQRQWALETHNDPGLSLLAWLLTDLRQTLVLHEFCLLIWRLFLMGTMEGSHFLR